MRKLQAKLRKHPRKTAFVIGALVSFVIMLAVPGIAQGVTLEPFVQTTSVCDLDARTKADLELWAGKTETVLTLEPDVESVDRHPVGNRMRQVISSDPGRQNRFCVKWIATDVPAAPVTRPNGSFYRAHLITGIAGPLTMQQLMDACFSLKTGNYEHPLYPFQQADPPPHTVAVATQPVT